jgi:hypothetical protein
MALPPAAPVLTTATTPAEAKIVLVFNERVKLIAGFLNSVGVLFVAYGVVAYIVQGDIAGDLSALWIFIWTAAGVGLCGLGWRMLGELRT